MSNTVIAEDIGQPNNAYALVALPSERYRNTIMGLLDNLVKDLGDIIWPTPADALHMTLCEIIQPKPYSEDKQILYGKHKSEYEEVPRQIFTTFKPIRVHFNIIEVSPQAIIVRGEDNGSFNLIRADLVKNLPLPIETRRPPDIIHSSIARYTKSVDIAEVEPACQKYAIDVEEEVTTFQLVHNTKPPLLEYEILRSYSLSG